MLIWLLLSPAVGLLALLLLDHVERQMVSSLTPHRQPTDASNQRQAAPLLRSTHIPRGTVPATAETKLSAARPAQGRVLGRGV